MNSTRLQPNPRYICEACAGKPLPDDGSSFMAHCDSCLTFTTLNHWDRLGRPHIELSQKAADRLRDL
jgi:hypothetical protein